MLDRPIDEALEVSGRFFQSLWSMDHVQIKDDAGVRFFGPGEKALVIPFDETENAKDDVYLSFPAIEAHLSQPTRQFFSRHVKLANHLTRLVGGAQPLVQIRMIVVDVGTQLVRVRPVKLAGSGSIVIRILFKHPPLIDVRQIEQPLPSLDRQLFLDLRNDPIIQDGTIARDYPAPQKSGRIGIAHVLKIPIERSVGYPLLKHRDQVLQIKHLNNPFQLSSGSQAQSHRRNRSEQAISAD